MSPDDVESSRSFQLFKGIRGDSFGRLFRRELFKLSAEFLINGIFLLCIAFYISENYDRAYYYNNTDHGGQLLSLHYGTAWLCLISSVLGLSMTRFWGRFTKELSLLLIFIKIFYCFSFLAWSTGLWCCLVLFNTFGKRKVGGGYAEEMFNSFVCTAFLLFLVLIFTPIHIINISYYSSEASNGESIAEPEDSQLPNNAKSVSQFLTETYITFLSGSIRAAEFFSNAWIMVRTVATGDFSSTSMMITHATKKPQPPSSPQPSITSIRIRSLHHDDDDDLEDDDDVGLNDDDDDDDDVKYNDDDYETDYDNENPSPYDKWKSKSMEYWRQSPEKIHETKQVVSNAISNAHGMIREIMAKGIKSPLKRNPVMVEEVDDEENNNDDDDDDDDDGEEEEDHPSIEMNPITPIKEREESSSPVKADDDDDDDDEKTDDLDMSPIEFHTLWPLIIDSSGQFTCTLTSRVEVDSLLQHLQARGFLAVYVSTGSDLLQEIGVCNVKLTPDQPRFLAKFVIDGLNFSANVRCEDKTQSNAFVRSFQLSKILTIEN